MNPFATGGNQRKKDKRDYKSSSIGSAIQIPDTFSSPVPIIYNQSKLPTCGAHAGAQLANILFGEVTAPQFLWKIIKQIDGFTPEDGTDMRSIFKALKDTGICKYALLPNPTDYSWTNLQLYTSPSTITQEMLNDASTRKIGGYGFIDNPNFEQIKTAIYTYRAVILLVGCGDGWWKPSYARKDIIPLRLGNYASGHFIVATQYGATVIDGANSWGVSWADTGMFEFLENYLPYILELGFATVAPIAQQYIFTQDLYLGLKSADVHALQIRLGVTPTTGFFGSKTFSAVRKYQTQNGILSTGFVGPKTRFKLNGM